MKRLPNRPDIDHLRKQAKTLLALWRDRDLAAIDRDRKALPAVGRSDETIANLGLRLHDAQSCIAREYGFLCWADLEDIRRNALGVEQGSIDFVLHCAAEVAGGTNLARIRLRASLMATRRTSWIDHRINDGAAMVLLHGHYLASTLLRGSRPLSGASVLSASRLEPLVPFPLASPARFSRSVQEPD